MSSRPQPAEAAMNAREREYFSTNLAMLLKAAVPVGEAVESLAETTKSRPMKHTLARISEDIDQGLSLSEALKHSKLVGRQTLTLIEIGEQSGNLVENLKLAAEQEQKQRLFRSKLRSAMMYPAFVLSLTLIVGLGIAWFLLPKLSDTFSQLNVTLPPISQAMINFGIFLRDNGLWAVPLILGSFIALVFIFTTIPFTRNLALRLVLHLPGIGKLAHELEIARFGYMLGTLLDAGLPVTHALELLEKATSSPPYQALYRHLGKSLQDGYSFKQSFKEFKKIDSLIPANARQVIVAGERSGSLTQTLKIVGSTYDDKVEITTKNFEVIIEPILLVIVWVGVMAVAVAVIMPIYTLIGGLGG